MSTAPTAARRRLLGGAPVDISHTANATSASDLTTYTFASQSFGVAVAGRRIVVAATGRGGGSFTLNSVTIGGVSATKVVGLAVSTTNIVDLWIADVPTGATGSVVLTFSGTMARAAISVFRMVDAGSATAHATATDSTASGNDMSVSLNVPAKGGAIAVVASNTASSITYTWSGLTEDADSGDIEGGWGMSAAHDNFVTLQSGLTITATQNTTPSSPAMVAASWGPA